MSVKKNKDFYVWVIAECIKNTYDFWGIDIMSRFDEIEKYFPNVSKAIKKMYSEVYETEENEISFFETEPLYFSNPQYVYEAISNFVPFYSKIRFNIKTKEQNEKYKNINIYSWDRYVPIRRIDLIVAVLLFTEEFIFLPLSAKNVFYTDNKLLAYGDFVTLKVSKRIEKTIISIKVRDVMNIEYSILN